MAVNSITDFLLDEEREDLAVDRLGALQTLSGEQTILNAVIRRAVTPVEGYARLVRRDTTVQIVDEDYYTELPFMLSSSDLNYEQVQFAFKRAANQDGRLTIQQADVYMTALGRHQVDLIYSLADAEPNVFNTVI